VSKPEVVVVTGASSGVGRAVAERFGRAGAHVALLARSGGALGEAAAAVERLGGKALPVPTDVADPDAVEVAATATEETFGEIDIWVNNAMATVFAFFHDVEPDEFRRATDVTYLGAVWGTRAALRRMRPRDRGAIILVGSALAYRGIPLQSPYCGAKHALKGFFESVRTELLHEGSNVQMTMVQLPGLNTPQFEHCRSKLPRHPMPVPPIYEPEVAADAIFFAAREYRRELWIGASTVYTIVGEKLVPSAGDWYMARTGVDGQQTDEPIDPPREGNLFDADVSKPRVRGKFDNHAHSHSGVFWLSKRRRGVVAATVIAALAAVAARRGQAD
jgi:NAD(P)-dependent dehydrogenase (short-subunit alcohol dehydrogenase family)